MKEIRHKRKPREKHFLHENGLMSAILYDKDIHYLKNGVYEEINNTIKEEKDYYINDTNTIETFYAKKTKDFFMKLNVNSYNMIFSLEGMNFVSGTLKENKVIYSNLLNDMDFIYELTNSQIKESIVLTNNKTDTIVFHIQTNLKLKLLKNRAIKVYDDKKIYFYLDVPYMVDHIDQKNDNCFYELYETDGGYDIVLKLDKAFLNDKNTVYPVIVDPTITNKTQSNNVYDTFIFPNGDDIDRNSTDLLKVGFDAYENINTVFRTLLKFELPTIGTGYDIVSAYVNIVSHHSSFFEITKTVPIINVHAINQNWDENSAKWSNMSDKYNSRIESTFKFIATDIDGANYRLRNNSFDLTNLVKKWYSGTPNYGILLKSDDESNRPNVKVASFCSKNYTQVADTPKPLLIITYQNQNGLEDYFSYQEQSFDSGTSYINTYNGNLTSVFQLGETLGTNNPIQLSLIYNTNDVVLGHDYGCGLGCKFSYDQSIKEVMIENQLWLEYLDEDGTKHYFYQEVVNGQTIFKDEDGLFFTITKDNENYKMSRNGQENYLFVKHENIWYLHEIINDEQKKITINRNDQNRIIEVIDDDQKSLVINYETNKISVSNSIDTCELIYNNNCLVQLVNKRGTTTLEYDNNKIINRIIDVNGMSVKYYYYGYPYKVKRIEEVGLNQTVGNSLEFVYGFQTTTVKDVNGHINTYTFNDRGNNVGVTSLNQNENLKDAFGANNMYGDYSGSINKLTLEDVTMQYVKNYLSNTSFESSSIYFNGTEETEVAIVNENALTGNYSMKVNSINHNQSISQSISVPKGEYYTFSANIQSNKDLYIQLSYQTPDNNTITEKQLVYASQNYIREEVTIMYPNTAISDLKISILIPDITTFYMDDIQLEEGEVANYYNLVENSDFSNGKTGWDIRAVKRNSDTDVVEIPSDDSIVTLPNNIKALKINASPTVEKVLTRSFVINGKAGDTFNLSFWYKNLGINSPFMYPSQNALIRFHYTEECTGQGAVFNAEFNRSDDWQFFSRNFRAEFDYDRIDLTIFNMLNANEFYITNFSLFKDLSYNSFEYDSNGNLVVSNNMSVQTNEFKYDQKNQLVKIADKYGSNFYLEYDNNIQDRILSLISPNGVANEIQYDNNGNPISIKTHNIDDGLNLNHELYYIRQKGTKKYLKADLFHNRLILDEDSCSHDPFVLEKIDDDFRIKYMSNQNYYIAFINNTLLLTKQLNETCLFQVSKNQNGSYSIKPKNSFQVLTVINDGFQFQQFQENNSNQQFYFESEIQPNFIENNATYSEDGSCITSTTDSLYRKTTYQVDPSTRLINGVIDPNGNVINYTYNEREEIIEITDGDQKVNYSYNSHHLIDSIIHGTKNYNFEYNDFLNLKEISINDQILLSKTYENNNGKLSSITFGNGDQIKYSYDQHGRVNKIEKENDIIDHKYNNFNQLSKVTSNSGKYRYVYDMAQRLKSYTYNQFRIDYNYDDNSNITETHYRLNNLDIPVIYSYDQDSNLTEISNNGKTVKYVYDELDRIQEIKWNNQTIATYYYVTNGEKTSDLVKTFISNDIRYDYKYDRLNNITHVYKDHQLIHYYNYDRYNQLTSDEDLIHEIKWVYTYDLYGNMISKKCYDLNNEQLLTQDSYNYQNQTWKDQLTKFNNEEITYDLSGNPLTIGENKVLTWENGHELSKIQIENDIIQYKYDKNGVRCGKIINDKEIHFYTENNQVIFETFDNQVLYFLREATGDLIGFVYNDIVYYYLKNDREDILGILDSNYNPIVYYEYDAYGNIISVKNANGQAIEDENHIGHINPFRYHSYYYDCETGFYYLNSRYYNPLWGRFLNPDKELGANGDLISYNLYNYTSNNPINYIDEDGEFSLSLGLAAGMVAGGLLLAGALYNGVKAGVEFLGAAFSNISSGVNSMSKAKEASKTKKKKKQTNYKQRQDHMVYTLRVGSKTGTVMYVGRTVDKKQTERRHKMNESRSHLVLDPVKENLSYEQARGLEQILIMKHIKLNEKKI